ncbi:MAG: PEP-CTERM sorting domain-containing protein [bacterium]|nr:PEP-CTERM sorting domain-containing protein [bacterium]
MNALNDWNARRKAHGRIRRARQRRRRQQVTAIAALLLLLLGAVAAGTIQYGAKKHKQHEIATTSNMSYSLPRIEPLLARAETPKPENELPQMLNIRERFPDYDGGPRPEEPEEDGSSEESEEPSDDALASMVILDDLRAAPPKSMFVRAVFENADKDYEPQKSRRWSKRKWHWGGDEIFGRKHRHKRKKKHPPIPEPGTAVLLGLGLVTMSSLRRRNRNRTRAGVAAASKQR